jgi:hypothetical protein
MLHIPENPEINGFESVCFLGLDPVAVGTTYHLTHPNLLSQVSMQLGLAISGVKTGNLPSAQ